MSVSFRTLRELKQKLPEVLREIEQLNKMADATRVMLDGQMHSVCRGFTRPTQYSWFDTEEAVKESYGHLLYYEMRASWLQSQVDKLKAHPDI